MKQYIEYTVELLMSGNLNIYEGKMCYEKNFKFKNISPEGAAYYVGGWVLDWVASEKEVRNSK